MKLFFRFFVIFRLVSLNQHYFFPNYKKIVFSSNGDPHIGDDDGEADFVLQITDESQNRDYSLNFKRKLILSLHLKKLFEEPITVSISF